jgi:hypothetical protein
MYQGKTDACIGLLEHSPKVNDAERKSLPRLGWTRRVPLSVHRV